MADTDRGPSVGRRHVFTSVALAGATGLLPGATHAETMQMKPATTPTPTQPTHAYQFFNADEADFIEAAVDTIIPTDDVGPGALEAGVAIYIDRQMAGGFGKGARLYMQGPFAEGTPQQGYQLPLVPSELIRAGIADTAAWCLTSRKSLFNALSPEDRAAVLKEVETNKAHFEIVPPVAFFNMLLQLTQEGYFADPIYGGNRDKAVWRMIGFPGVGGMYADDLEKFRNKPYPVDPKSIQDLA